LARPKTNKKNVSGFIANAIFRGELKPGTIVTEEWLGKNLNVSRTPVREALISLQAEGLIKVVNRRATVTTITPMDIQEIYEIRLLLEPYAARVCIGMIDRDKVRRIRDYTQSLLNETRGNDFSRTNNVHALMKEKTLEIRNSVQGLIKQESADPNLHIHDIHDLIIASTRNQRLVKITRNLQSQIKLLLNAAERIPGRIIQSMEEHLLLIDAILADDSAMAEAHMRTHIQTNMKDMLDSNNFRFIFKEDL
jgi:DNA-binding GntR family transcriptional regulator